MKDAAAIARPLRSSGTRLVVALLGLGALGAVVAARNAPRRVVDMVAVPAGTFFMGCAEQDAECGYAERPGRTVPVATFSIDRYEVTVADYGRCATAGQCATDALNRPSRTDFNTYCNWGVTDRDRHPINCVDWAEAAAYCAWAGKRLPTEVEWEKAARGTDGRIFPWAAQTEASGRPANLHQGGVPFPDPYDATAPVGSFPAGASPYGALDMSGNVSEWLADSDRDGRAVRGGAWMTHPRYARASFRSWFPQEYRDAVIGFRCAR